MRKSHEPFYAYDEQLFVARQRLKRVGMKSHHGGQNVVEAIAEEEYCFFFITDRLRCEMRPLLMMRITHLRWNTMCVSYVCIPRSKRTAC